MAYKRLSELVLELDNPQRADSFVKLFRAAVRNGEFDAIELPGRFTMPKEFSRRNGGASYQRQTKEMAFEGSPQFDEWLVRAKEELASKRGTKKPKLSFEMLETGEVDFKTLAEQTRTKLKGRYEKGQKLGQSRTQKDIPSPSKTPAVRAAKTKIKK